MVNSISVGFYWGMKLLNFLAQGSAGGGSGSGSGGGNLWLGLHLATQTTATVTLSTSGYTIPVADPIGDHSFVIVPAYGDIPADIWIGNPAGGGSANPAPYTGLSHGPSVQVAQAYPDGAPFDRTINGGQPVKFSPSPDGFTVLEPRDSRYERVPIAFDPATVVYPSGVLAVSNVDCVFPSLLIAYLATHLCLWDAKGAWNEAHGKYEGGNFLGAGETGLRYYDGSLYANSDIAHGDPWVNAPGTPAAVDWGYPVGFPKGSIGFTLNTLQSYPYSSALGYD